MYIGAEKVYTTAKMSSTNPSHPSEVIGVFQAGTKDNARTQPLPRRGRRFEDRGRRCRSKSGVECLVPRREEVIRDRKFESFGVDLLGEVGKSWAEADGDTAETIDFLEFYAREEMLRLAGPQAVTPMKGEKNFMWCTFRWA